MILKKIITKTKEDLEKRKNDSDFNKFLKLKRNFKDVKKLLNLHQIIHIE